MLLITDTHAYAAVKIGSDVVHLEGLSKYYRYLQLVRRNRVSTIENRLNAVYHFWLWTLCNATEVDEDLQLYFARYLVALEEGFIVHNETGIEDFDEKCEYEIFRSRPKMPSTIEKEKRAVESFLKYMGTIDAKKLELEKNFLGYAHRAKHGKGAGYGLRMSKYMQEIFLDDVSILPAASSPVIGDIRAFPFVLFNDLLEIAEPREKLLYLLYGACSARLTQALNLTIYDIDYENMNVWLIDPRTNDQLGFHGRGRKTFLWEEYGIDATKQKPHKHYGFKAPIPKNFKERMPLLWLHNGYQTLFFETLADYNPPPESTRNPRHPFFFVTKSGKRLSSSFVNDRFGRHLKELKKMHPKFSNRLDGIGIHALRHMFGSVMATLDAKLIISGQSNLVPKDFIRWFTGMAMGHRNNASTNIYFHRPWDIEIELGEFVQALIADQILLMPSNENRKMKNGKKTH